MFNKRKVERERRMGFNQTIHFENVVSRYYQVDLKDFAKAFEDFVTTVVKSGYTPTSNFFYAINSDLEDPVDMLLQVFIPVEEDKSYELPENYRYQSYYEVINMVGVRVEGDSESQFSEGIRVLVEQIVEMDAELASPPFYFVNQIGDKTFTDILIKISVNV
ncbi:DUF5085 domain-containing protein [Carnobacterium divergens]|uniref:DUF5085 domain-containing protein n=2 Tax=Carnobacteriaceae TaxID=186828 RepID=A0A2R7ZYY5_CARDV|nr:DUF5085 family protein [Carnobacterium divergens]TFI64723.1 DUF5085 domain-containing protein [Carnobacterium divergens]TFI75581.1 DUF5085 domain-containing protein [Carnobacterium divergens]TFI75798.1 DUF5085 domain-containing protein [Carnobacterium divergens]TFI79734.1 DUF5085 domain-containing protein [Carnobacterium divergens]